MIECYEQIANASRRMLAAARAEEWDLLTEVERECAGIIDRLRGMGNPEAMSDDGRRRRMEIIRQVLVDDAEIRRLAEPWLARMESYLRGCDNDRRLRDAYQ